MFRLLFFLGKRNLLIFERGKQRLNGPTESKKKKKRTSSTLISATQKPKRQGSQDSDQITRTEDKTKPKKLKTNQTLEPRENLT